MSTVFNRLKKTLEKWVQKKDGSVSSHLRTEFKVFGVSSKVCCLFLPFPPVFVLSLLEFFQVYELIVFERREHWEKVPVVQKHFVPDLVVFSSSRFFFSFREKFARLL